MLTVFQAVTVPRPVIVIFVDLGAMVSVCTGMADGACCAATGFSPCVAVQKMPPAIAARVIIRKGLPRRPGLAISREELSDIIVPLCLWSLELKIGVFRRNVSL